MPEDRSTCLLVTYEYICTYSLPIILPCYLASKSCGPDASSPGRKSHPNQGKGGLTSE